MTGQSDGCVTPARATPPKKNVCPVSGTHCAEVSMQTISHHFKNPWAWDGKAQDYYFCDDPACEVVYFGEDLSVVTTQQLRTAIGVKSRTPEATLCYCFGVAFQDQADPAAREYVIARTKAGDCACELRNPSGRCCLKDFAKICERAI